MRSGLIYSVLLGLMLATRGHGIAVDDYSVAETTPASAGYSFDWAHIYNYQYSSAVAVDHYWILTAAHVADDGASTTNLTIDGETYTQQEIVFHDTADLALVRYDKPFPGYYALHEGEIFTGSGRNKTYNELIMVGFGFDGTVAATSFTQGAIRGIERWGTNRGVGESPINTDAGGTVGAVSTSCFEVDFDLGNTAYEAGANVYDSGGPVFIDNGAGWALTGINLYRNGANPYTGNHAAMIHDYIGWIKSVIVDYDTDMDGLPDHWESSTGETEAGADPDEDGFANYEEWIADTDPTLGSSFLQVMEFTHGVGLVFSSSTNRKYQIEQNQNLTNLIWTAASGWFEGSYPNSVTNLPATDSNRFYRVRAKLP